MSGGIPDVQIEERVIARSRATGSDDIPTTAGFAITTPADVLFGQDDAIREHA